MKAWLVMSIISTVVAFKGENAWKLKILTGYDKNIPPSSILSKDPLRGGIDLGIMLRRLEDFSATRGTLSLVGYLYKGWRDDRLIWNPDSDFQKHQYVGIDPSKIWKPTLHIFNSVKQSTESSQPLFVLPIGLVYSSYVAKINTECTPTMELFPFDKHTCHIVFGVMSSKSENIETHAKVDIPIQNWSIYLVENSKWKINTFVASREYYKPLSDHDIVIPAKIYTITFQRKSPLIALGILTVALVSVVFGLLPFWLPPVTSFVGLRLALCIVGLMTASQTSDAIYKFAPAQHGQTPLIAKYCVFCSILTVLSLLETLTVSHLTRLSTKPSTLIESVASSTPSNFILRFWGIISGQVQGEGDGSYLIMEENEAKPRQNEVNWTTVALLIDSCGFILQFSSWIILGLMCVSF